MKLILPMAGRGSRFAGSGYERPKPLILVNGIPMFIRSLDSVKGVAYSDLIIIALAEHEEQFGISQYIKDFQLPNTKLITLPDVTKGQLCTVMAAKELIDTPEDVLILSSDTIVFSGLGKEIETKKAECRGLISVAEMPGDRWSFAAIDETGRVTQVAEKQRISPYASTGLYYFSNGKELVRQADEMIARNETTKGEFYVIPVYQKMIDQGDYVGISVAKAMWDLGTPDSLSEYLEKFKE